MCKTFDRIGGDANKNHVRREKSHLEDHPHLKHSNTKATLTQQELATTDMDLKQRRTTTKTPLRQKQKTLKNKTTHKDLIIITTITNSTPHKTSHLTFQLPTQHQ